MDLLVALGGSSAIDTAKEARWSSTRGRSARPGLPIVAVNTTAGTGSECTDFYIVTDPARHSKMTMSDPNCSRNQKIPAFKAIGRRDLDLKREEKSCLNY